MEQKKMIHRKKREGGSKKLRAEGGYESKGVGSKKGCHQGKKWSLASHRKRKTEVQIHIKFYGFVFKIVINFFLS